MIQYFFGRMSCHTAVIPPPANGFHAIPAGKIGRIEEKTMLAQRSRPIAAGTAEQHQRRDARNPGHMHEAGILRQHEGGMLQDLKRFERGGLSYQIEQPVAQRLFQPVLFFRDEIRTEDEETGIRSLLQP